MELYEEFPYLENEKIIIRKMEPGDAKALMEISHNENVYKFIPPFLYQKNEKFLTTAIQNLSG